MKTIFNFILLGALAAVLFAAPGSARADAVYFSKRTVLADFFPNSKRVTYHQFKPSADQRSTLAKRLGHALPKKSYTFFVALTDGTIDGYALIDDEPGQHRPITFAIKLDADGVVLRQEIMVYRESWGSEVRDARFREQFAGKTVDDPITCGDDIAAVSGATISSGSMARGVRRALFLFESARTELEKRFAPQVSRR